MTVLFVILGILLIGCGFSLMFTPLLTFIDAGYVIVVLMAIFGIVNIIRSIIRKDFGINFIFAILSTILGIVMLIFPLGIVAVEGLYLIIAAVWIIVTGIVSIASAITLKKEKAGGIWILQLIIGILGIILGFCAIFNPLILAIASGILIGFFFIDIGFTMIFSGIAARD